MTTLIERAREIQKSIDLQKLKRDGISRDRLSYEFVPIYPPAMILTPINPEEIHPTQKKHKVAFYVHVPFCTSIETSTKPRSCIYCSYYKAPITKENIDKYMHAVQSELDLLLLNTGGIEVSSILIGGGTPPSLPLKRLEELVKFLFERLAPKKGTQITIESSPETLSRWKLENLSALGVNRLNIGVQSFDDVTLHFLRRRHDASQAEHILKTAQKYFAHVNIDLMFGLPGQTPVEFEYDLRKIKEIMPQSLSVYQLRMTNSDCAGFYQRAPQLFADEQNCLLMNIMQLEFLQNSGYTLDPVSYFSLAEHLRFQDVLNKWERQEEILGIGPSAYSFIGGVSYYNVRSLDQYVKILEQGQLPIWVGKRLSIEEQTARRACLGIRSIRGIDISPEILDSYQKELNHLQECGLIEMAGNKLKLTYSGILYADEVSREFYTPQDKQELEKLGLKYGCYFRE